MTRSLHLPRGLGATAREGRSHVPTPLLQLVCLACQLAEPSATALMPNSPLALHAALVLAPEYASLHAPVSIARVPTWSLSQRDPQPAVPLPTARAPGIGDHWSLGSGRALTVYLTPSPAQCAPLMEMKF